MKQKGCSPSKALKNCSYCEKEFLANSGSSLKCSDCKKCKECDKQLKYSHRKFCGHICAGKYLYRNNPQMQTIKENSKKRLREHLPKGKDHYNWQGGKTNERRRLMISLEYRTWRKQVFERDNYTCQHCNKRGIVLEADHIVPYCINKELATDLNNGRTLCRECHLKTDTWGIKARNYKRENF